MDGAAAVFQKLALRVARHAEAAHISCAVNVPLLESLGRQIEESGETRDVLFGKIDEPLLLATFCAAGLALEAQ